MIQRYEAVPNERLQKGDLNAYYSHGSWNCTSSQQKRRTSWRRLMSRHQMLKAFDADNNQVFHVPRKARPKPDPAAGGWESWTAADHNPPPPDWPEHGPSVDISNVDINCSRNINKLLIIYVIVECNTFLCPVDGPLDSHWGRYQYSFLMLFICLSIKEFK